MPNNIILAIFSLLLLSAILVYKKLKKPPTSHITSANTPNASISAINQQTNNVKKLTLKERVELSWKFLYDITELIVNKFSREDANLVNQIGHTLIDNGVRYEHVVDLGIKQTISQTQAIEQAQIQTQATQRSV